ncbi:cysteine-rich repeat secretory protein 38-like [Telopea speciosissima]|uniref:cysteine-rich repeat secretory protein 38-like n=1 Tax=Telopea speciosissima TaxID=54955 RepID=UPI001CC6B8CD|nr:cysteine-rich repeat secretory protein 38-like [Telopea speciosissima]
MPSLLALNCTSQHKQTFIPNKSITSFFDILISTINATRLVAFKVGTRPDPFDGFMQCRLDLSFTACALCARVAKDTISTLCPNPESVTAWFNGCYIQYYNDSKFSQAVQVFSSTSNKQSKIIEMGRFEVALEILLLQLRASITVASHLGFSRGEIVYGRNESRIYAVAECVRLVSLRDCEICVGDGIKKLHECCGGKVGGVVVAGHCMVQFEVYQFFSRSITYGNTTGSDSEGETRVVSYKERENDGSSGFRLKVVRAWGVGAVLFMGIIVGAWLLKRKIVNTAKVAEVK